MNTKDNDKTTKIHEGPYPGLIWRERVPIFDSNSSPNLNYNTASGADAANNKLRPCRDAEDMLIKVMKKPHLNLTPLYQELGFSGYMGKKCKLELIRLSFVTEVKLPANRRGRRKTLLQILPKGRAYLDHLGVAPGSKTHGKGNVKHIFYQQALKDWYETHGYTIEIEARLGQVTLDLLAIKIERRIGIQITLTTERIEAENAAKVLEGGLEHLLFIVETKSEMDNLRSRIESVIQDDNQRAKIGYKLVGDYFGDD